MKPFSYIISTTALSELPRIDTSRNLVLTTLLSPKAEIKLRFEARLNIIESSLLLSGKVLSRREVYAALSGKRAAASVMVDEVAASYDYIKENLLLSGEKVSPEAILKILRIFKKDRKISRDDAIAAARFITVSADHGLAQAAIAFVIFATLLPHDNDGIKISIIISNCFVYNQGYDLRGLLNMEEFFARDLKNLVSKMNSAAESRNLSEFIEYYIQTFSLAAEKAVETAAIGAKSHRPVPFFNLTKRQVRILTLFEIPGVQITNKDVQSNFGVSQITASRDLSNLATLGLLLRKGKGRSIYYIRA